MSTWLEFTVTSNKTFMTHLPGTVFFMVHFMIQYYQLMHEQITLPQALLHYPRAPIKTLLIPGDKYSKIVTDMKFSFLAESEVDHNSTPNIRLYVGYDLL